MVSTTAVAPTTPKQTTSQVPTTTSPAPTASPPNPVVGKYNVTGPNGTCVLAYMGLQLNITYLKKDEKVCFFFSSKPSDSFFFGGGNLVNYCRLTFFFKNHGSL